jgi:putative tryptophan/tyrosine transport system substrate-binding protein
MNRRKFIILLGGTAAALSFLGPVAASAQQPEQMRRIGVLMNAVADDPRGQARIVAFQQTLQKLGWSEGRNVQIDIRWGGNDVELDRRYAAELIALAPNVIMAAGTLSVTALQRHSHAIPIVFNSVSDPVGAGFVNNLAHPGGNVTGFMIFEYSMSGKWLELLKQIVPQLTRVAVLRDSVNPAGIAQFGAIRATGSSLGVDVSPIDVRNASEIEHDIAAFARTANGGLIVTGSAIEAHRDLIIGIAAKHKVPAVYTNSLEAAAGGLISYGPNLLDQFRSAAGYVDRILRGEKPGDLPVQVPTKFELVINLKTAKTIGVIIPQSLLASADEVIE